MPIVTTSSRRRPRKHPALSLIAIGVLAVVGAACFLLLEVSASSGPPPSDAKPATVAPAVAKNPEAASRTELSKVSADVPAEPHEDSSHESAVAPTPAPTSEAPSEGIPMLEVPEASADEQPRHFNGVAEQLIALAMNADEEHGMPPLPIPPEKQVSADFLVAITNDIVVYEDDPPSLVELKERVADAKNQIKAILESGGTVTDSLKEYQDYVNEGKRLRTEVTLEYKRLLTEASEKEAEDYLAQANKALEAEGIKRIMSAEELRMEQNKRILEAGQAESAE